MNIRYNARARLDYVGFDDEIEVLDQYLKILGADLGMDESRIEIMRSDREIPPVVLDVPLAERLGGLFDERALDLDDRGAAKVAVSGFARPDGRICPILALLDEMANNTLADRFTMVERQRIDQVLREQELALSDLMETTRAIEVGRLLAADYILTGTVIPMAGSVVIFSRLINSSTAVIETTAQVIVPMDREVTTLL